MRRAIFSALCALCLLSSAVANSFLARDQSDWLKDLSRKDPASRRSAAFALGRMGNAAAGALSELARRAESDPDAGVREMAAAAIGEIALDMQQDFSAFRYREVSPALETALKDKDARVRRGAAYALGAFGKSAAPASAAIRKALRDTSPAVRQNAAWALGRTGKPDAGSVGDLCDLLQDKSPLVRRDSAAALEKLGQGNRKALASAGKPLLDLVKNEKDDVVRKTALGALASLSGPEHQDHAPDLYPLLDSKDEETARGAAYVLGNMGGEPARRALPTLKKALTSSDPVVQQLAAATLANGGADAAEAIKALAGTLSASKDNSVRRNCCVAISLISREPGTSDEAAKAVPDLVEAMKPGTDKSRPGEQVRELAAEALAQMRYPANESAMPAVRQTIIKDRNKTVRHRCIWALFNVADLEKHDLVKPLTDLLDEKDDSTQFQLLRYDGARVLARSLKDKAPDRAVEVLLHMLTNKELQVFRKTDASIQGAGNEGGGGTSGVAADQGGDARYMAAEALSWMKTTSTKNPKVIPALKEALMDKDERLQKAAAKALEELGEK
jgi:HEAT repeat protein